MDLFHAASEFPFRFRCAVCFPAFVFISTDAAVLIFIDRVLPPSPVLWQCFPLEDALDGRTFTRHKDARINGNHLKIEIQRNLKR